MAAALASSAIVLAAAGVPSTDGAAPSARLSASFSPERLGGATTISVGFRVTPAPGRRPLAVTAMELYLPAGLGVVSNDLGLETCQLAWLEQSGLGGCPPDSLMGRGQALTKVPFGATFVDERVAITLLSGPLLQSDPQLLFLASGGYPVIAQVAFSARVTSTHGRYGAVIAATMPLVPGVPKGPDVALVSLRTTIGPAGIVYYERVHGHLISFRPRGIQLPSRCPHGGFPFRLSLSFSEGPPSTATTTVPCPTAGAHRRSR